MKKTAVGTFAATLAKFKSKPFQDVLKKVPNGATIFDLIEKSAGDPKSPHLARARALIAKTVGELEKARAAKGEEFNRLIAPLHKQRDEAIAEIQRLSGQFRLADQDLTKDAVNTALRALNHATNIDASAQKMAADTSAVAIASLNAAGFSKNAAALRKEGDESSEGEVIEEAADSRMHQYMLAIERLAKIGKAG